jgi:REP element-mobilizing transposase RayT
MNAMYNRRSIRLKDYDYTQAGAYFVTICAYQRRCVFGSVENGLMRPNTCGQIVQYEWEQTAVVRPHVELDAFVVMPNHIHGIIVITDHVDIAGDGRGMMHHAPTIHIADQPPQRKFSKPIANSLSSIVGTFKAAVTRRINTLPGAPDHPIWQRNYHEHIIRNQHALDHIRAYVAANPSQWAADSLFIDDVGAQGIAPVNALHPNKDKSHGKIKP